MPSKKTSFLLMMVVAFAVAACSGLKSSTGTGGTGTGGGSFTIGGTVTGLSGTGLVLTDNGQDTLTITGTTLRFRRSPRIRRRIAR
jgi:hypothetical protein